ncbi:MAG: helix-hairpin-helix domain-containing protein [Rhodoglobus sp.]
MEGFVERRRARLRVRVGAVVVLVLVGLGCAVLAAALGQHGSAREVVSPQLPPTPEAAVSGTEIFIHILGAVQRPGLYTLGEGDRAIDAVAAAGGFLDIADQRQLNLARFVVDGEQIVVPAKGEVSDAAAAAPGTSADGKVNINTADEATLDTLPRVGPAMAARIIAWRDEHGRFTAIEDLMNITGIGDKTFEGMRDMVTV